MSVTSTVQSTRQSILDLLDELPPESLTVVEALVRFLRDQARQGQPVIAAPDASGQPRFRYPTVPVPASSLDKWLDLLSQGYAGDALADTEALYDEV
jgi:hypothetical protein